MKYYLQILLLFISFNLSAQEKFKVDLPVERKVINEEDGQYGYYYRIYPKTDTVKGVLILLPGFGQGPESILADSKLPKEAFENGLITILYAGRMRLTSDSFMTNKLNEVLHDFRKLKQVRNLPYYIGGFSAGGTIALRYTELCYQFPKEYPIHPKAVFMADAPIDLYHNWEGHQVNLKSNLSEIAVNEAKWLYKFFNDYYGATPSEDVELYQSLTAFDMNAKEGHEKYLKNVAVRAYHDVDIVWRIVERNQTPQYANFIPNAELINRLILAGNDQAEFMQTYQTGIRRNGQRHPHSWSIIDAKECVEWLINL